MPFIVYVKKRPGCDFFLKEMSKLYEVMIYTASLAEYADPVVDLLDQNKQVSYRLFRENCTLYNGVFVKDLAQLGRNLKDIILVDVTISIKEKSLKQFLNVKNSETSFIFQPDNAYHIKAFFEDPNDRELYILHPFLHYLNMNNDIRCVQQKFKEFQDAMNCIQYINCDKQVAIYNKEEAAEAIKQSLQQDQQQQQQQKQQQIQPVEEIEDYQEPISHRSSHLDKQNEDELELELHHRNQYSQQKQALIKQSQDAYDESSSQDDFKTSKRKLINSVNEMVQGDEENCVKQQPEIEHKLQNVDSNSLLQLKEKAQAKNRKNAGAAGKMLTQLGDGCLAVLDSQQVTQILSQNNNSKMKLANKKQFEFTKKPDLTIEIPADEETADKKLYSTRNSLNSKVKAKEVEDYLFCSPRMQEKENIHKTMPDEEDPEYHKQSKQLFEEIRYENNNLNVNSPVAKERLIQFLKTSRQKKNAL